MSALYCPCGCDMPVSILHSLADQGGSAGKLGEVKAAIARAEEAEGKLEFARNYKGIEARACPLCRYEDGVFKGHCEPHRQLAQAEIHRDIFKKAFEEQEVKEASYHDVIRKLEDQVEGAKAAAIMVAHEDCFFSTYDDVSKGHPQDFVKLCVLVNDAFWWATADAEAVPEGEILGLYEIWKRSGHHGLLVWVCKRRNMKPQKPLYDKLPKEVQDQVEDLPRSGGDDGWGK